MADAFNCPHCKKQMQVEDHLAGQQVFCPSCGQTLTAPGSPPTAPSATLHYAPGSRERRAGLAIASLVLGIVGFCTGGIAGIVGVILGIVALVKASHEQQVDRGRGFAIGGIVTGAVSLLSSLIVFPLMIAILLPSLSVARETAKQAVCAANLRAVEAALLEYVEEHGQEPPNLTALIDENMLDPRGLICPSVDPAASQTPPYIWNRGVDCADPANIIAYEPIQNHHGEGGNVLFCDGHIEFVLEDNWEQTLRDGGANLP
jgi:prepilin-type processing-associated H-X9-DG protein